MWHVNVDNKDLKETKSGGSTSLHGPHRVCLTHDQIVFVPANNNGGTDSSRGTPIEIPITSVRIFGHKEGMFFIEPGRASGIGKGKLWLDLNDEVMADYMHQTILQVMYAINQEESGGYRGRSYSSGSNSSRTRSIRTHHNNPPPSQIGMGKVSGANNRLRCDSLPVWHAGDGSDPRFRTGSEGEHTMKKPHRGKSGASSSAGRLMLSHNKRLNHHFYHYYNHSYYHSHAASLSGSCNGSSPTSSSEYLNVNPNVTESLTSTSNPHMQNPTAPDDSQNDDYASILPHSDKSQYSSSKEAGLNELSEYQDSHFSTYVGAGRYDSHYCSNCFAHIPYSHLRNNISFLTTERAPSPPDVDPPSNPCVVSPSSNESEYVNTAVHSRDHSMDESLSCDTAFSSLSASPQQLFLNSNYFGNITFAKNKMSPQSEPISSSPKSHLNAAELSSADEYTVMDLSSSNSKYPHQNLSETIQKQSSSIFSKLALKTIASESRKKCQTLDDSDYTVMASAVSTAKVQAINKHDYVPMRSFMSQQSMPQDICYRRRSIPDLPHRASNSSSYRSSPPYGFSPGEKFYELGTAQSLCQDCQLQLQNHRSSKPEDTHDNEMLDIAQSDSGLKLPPAEANTSSECKVAKDLVQSPVVHVTVADEAPNPVTVNDDNQDLKLQSLQVEIQQISNGSSEEGNLLSVSSIPMEHGANEVNGYLPMNPINGHKKRKPVVVKTSTNNNNRKNPSSAALTPQYPHQIKGTKAKCVTNSLDRPKRSPRSKRHKTISSLRSTSNGTARRTQSLRHSSKTSHEALGEANDVFNTAKSPLPIPPGGEYVNIDFAKAQEQLDSPHIFHSDEESNNNSMIEQLCQHSKGNVECLNIRRLTNDNVDPVKN